MGKLEHELFLLVLGSSRRVFRENFESEAVAMFGRIEFIDAKFALTEFFGDGEGFFDSRIVVESEVDLHLSEEREEEGVKVKLNYFYYIRENRKGLKGQMNERV